MRIHVGHLLTMNDNLLDKVEYYFNRVFPNRKSFCKGVSITLLSALTRNSVRSDRSSVRNTTRTNTYTLLCGASGAGKSTIRAHAIDILSEIGYRGIISDDITSEALPRYLSIHRHSTMFIEELGSFLGAHKKKTYLAGLVGMMTKAYDGTPISQERSSRESLTVTDYCFNIMAEIQPTLLSANADQQDIDSGFLPRFMIFYEDKLDTPGLEPLRDDELDLRKDIIYVAKKLYNVLANTQIECKFTYKHNRLISSVIKDMLYNKPIDHDSFYRRMEPNIYKLAMLKNIGDYAYIDVLNDSIRDDGEDEVWEQGHQIISKQTVKMPITDEAVEWAIQIMKEVLAPNIDKTIKLLYTTNADKVLLAVKTYTEQYAGAPMPRSLLYRYMVKYLDTNKEIEDTIELATKMRYIEAQHVQGGTRYKLVDYNKEEERERNAYQNGSTAGDGPW